MKKYIKPLSKAVKIETNSILAGSNRMADTNNTQGWRGNQGGFAKGNNDDDDWD